MVEFIQFIEVNEWEGETWSFWLQLTSNEDQLTRFSSMLSDAEDAQEYEYPYRLIFGDVVSESVVDNLVRYADEGYMDSHNKITGTFTCPDSLGHDSEELYKGGIRDYFN